MAPNIPDPSAWVGWNSRIIRKDRKTYIASMFFVARPPPNQRCVTKSSNDDKRNLNSLLEKMSAKGSGAYYHSGPATIVSLTSRESKGNRTGHRIDSQSPINPSDPRINLQYQVESDTHAQVTVNMRPLHCPSGLEEQMMNNQESGGMGFTNGQVQGLIQKALRHSADNACYTDMHWVIVESRDRSRSRSRDRSRSRERIEIDEILFQAIRSIIRSSKGTKEALIDTGIKVGVKAAEVAVIKTAPKVATKVVGKTAVKAVPLLGLAAGAAFGIGRLVKGDFLGAVGEVASGAASCIPGAGTATSIAIDGALLARDVVSDVTGDKTTHRNL